MLYTELHVRYGWKWSFYFFVHLNNILWIWFQRVGSVVIARSRQGKESLCLRRLSNMDISQGWSQSEIHRYDCKLYHYVKARNSGYLACIWTHALVSNCAAMVNGRFGSWIPSILDTLSQEWCHRIHLTMRHHTSPISLCKHGCSQRLFWVRYSFLIWSAMRAL